MSATDIPGGDINAQIEATLASVLQQQGAGLEEGFADDAIGGVFDPTFFGEFEVPGMRGAVPSQVPSTINRPYYKSGDEWRLIQTLAPEEFRRVQDRMAFIGLLDDYRPGERDQKTINAVNSLLMMSNRRGSDWRSTLADYETNIQNGVIDPLGTPEGKVTIPAFQQVEDFATVRRRVTNYFRERLGRDATEAEMRIFSNSMMSDYRAAAQQRFEQQTQTEEFDPNVGAGREPEFREAIDPVARFEEAFESRMKPHLDTREQQAAVQSGAQTAQAGVTATDRELGI